MAAEERTEAPGLRLSRREAWTSPLPHLAGSPMTRALMRLTLAAFAPRLLELRGLEHVLPDRDPFILALNHSQHSEALLVPALLFHFRAGKRIHFMADWNFCLIPPVWLYYKSGQVITVDRKPARPRYLNVFKPLFTGRMPAFEQARARLAAGAPVGVFPEGTTNRNPRRLLAGYSGAARLSLETGVPVVPVGIRFPTVPAGQPVTESAPFVVDIGAPLQPAEGGKGAAGPAVADWHAQIMQEIGRLSRKSWHPPGNQR